MGNIGFWCPYFFRDSLLPRCAAEVRKEEWGIDGGMNGVEDGLTPPEKTWVNSDKNLNTHKWTTIECWNLAKFVLYILLKPF